MIKKNPFQKKHLLKALAFSFVLLFSNALISQTKSVEVKSKPTEVKKAETRLEYGIINELKIKTPALYKDSLAITLNSFSHKKPHPGGPTKATAYLSVTKQGVTEQITLSVHGTEGKSEFEDFDILVWKEYVFQLKKFDYDVSISLVISKKK